MFCVKNQRYGIALCVRSGGKVWWALDVTDSIEKVGNIN